MNKIELIEAMRNCEQTKGQSLYDHGLSVYEHFNKLDSLKCPKWYSDYKDQIVQNLHDP